jgi:acetyl esterase/lipase
VNTPAAIAERLRVLGNGFNLPEVQSLYAPLLAAQPTDGVRVQADLRYGEHARHVLDVYAPAAAASTTLRPVLVAFHGGGFIRGDKSTKPNAGWCFAREGLVTVLPNYRLAPDSRWPSGPEDVAAVVQWLRAHAVEICGDPDRIVLMGESAGAAHVAAAVLMRRFGVDRAAGVRGAVLLSGPYHARLERLARSALAIATPDPRNDAYFGTDDADALAAMSTVEHIDAAPLPLLIGHAERDLPQMTLQAGELFARLVAAHGFTPEWLVVPDHNHFSQTVALNTGDSSLSAPVLDFVRRHVESR